jgi:hypothetical protein
MNKKYGYLQITRSIVERVFSCGNEELVSTVFMFHQGKTAGTAIQ